ncbi:MAG: GNAT family N-acetyltransferase [Pseudomonadota bacterium]
MSVRPAIRDDVGALGLIAEASGLFPAHYLPEMIEPTLAGGSDIWRVFDDGTGPAGFSFATLEELTDRLWNILALAVHSGARRRGIGRELLSAAEAAMPDARMILIETTQLPDQAAARALYLQSGYEEEGRVRDFYGDGEDKVIFRKNLGGEA